MELVWSLVNDNCFTSYFKAGNIKIYEVSKCLHKILTVIQQKHMRNLSSSLPEHCIPHIICHNQFGAAILDTTPYFTDLHLVVPVYGMKV
jgi:hypothetical protein